MTIEPFLLTTAVLGVSIIGFSALIVALPRSTTHSGQGWGLNEAAGVELILEYSFALVFLSLIPLVIVRLISSESLSLRVCSFIVELFMIAAMLLQIYRMIVAYRRRSPPRSILVLMIMLLPGTILVVFPIFDIIDAGGWYELVLLWIIWALGLQFWFFITKQVRSSG
jgi:hypothetical protein